MQRKIEFLATMGLFFSLGFLFAAGAFWRL